VDDPEDDFRFGALPVNRLEHRAPLCQGSNTVTLGEVGDLVGARFRAA
jgi:hypothetical protein